jgi:hypothetical protein
MASAHNSPNVSAAVYRDVRAASEDRRRDQGQRAARRQRQEEHRQGVDHGPGCVHCDVTHGR